MSGRVICLWSGPRNVSTALMYSFAQLEDVDVVDEPLYAHYLRISGREHPGRDEVLASQDPDGNRVMRELLKRKRRGRFLFAKQMAHHLVDLDRGFLAKTTNVLLVRDPKEMLPSLTIQIPSATLADTGLRQQWELYLELEASGSAPVVLDSRGLLLDPAGVLSSLCEQIGVRYADAMLRWKAGPRPEDGVWASYWYHAVHRSTGFQPFKAKNEFPSHLEPLLAQCAPWYDKLLDKAIKAKTAT